jgi:hypothetical protein
VTAWIPTHQTIRQLPFLLLRHHHSCSDPDSQVTFNTWNDYTQKYIVLAYDASETLIAASSTDLDNGDFIVYVEDGTTITRIESAM